MWTWTRWCCPSSASREHAIYVQAGGEAIAQPLQVEVVGCGLCCWNFMSATLALCTNTHAFKSGPYSTVGNFHPASRPCAPNPLSAWNS